MVRRDIETLQCAKKVERKPGKDLEREQPAEEFSERRLAERHRIGLRDLIENDESMDGDQNRRQQKCAQRRFDERYRRAERLLLRQTGGNEFVKHGDCQHDEESIDDERAQRRQHPRHSR